MLCPVNLLLAILRQAGVSIEKNLIERHSLPKWEYNVLRYLPFLNEK